MTEARDTGGVAGNKARFAVVVRLFQWDDFVARQVARYAETSAGGDLFVSVDDTHGVVSGITHDPARVFRTTDQSLVSAGLAARFGKGSLVWWNNDYPQYAFRQAFPDYDHYVFVEYDSAVRTPLAPLVARVAESGLDFVAEPIRVPTTQWFWRPHTARAYPANAIRATLNCIVILSGRALDHLFARRLAMGQDPAMRHWPISEAFVATELARAGFALGALSDFGDTSRYDWFPPVLEERLDATGGAVFLHPVLDRPRFRASVLRNGGDWLAFLTRGSHPRRLLDDLPEPPGRASLARASWNSFRRDFEGRLWQRSVRAGLARRW